MSKDFERGTVFSHFWPQVGAQKSSIWKKIVFKTRLGSHPKAACKRSRGKRQHRGVKETIFSAFAVKDTYHACAPRPNVYSASWLSDVCCCVDTCVQHEFDVGARWRPKMEPKTAPYGPQDGIKIDLEEILRGFDVRTLNRTIRTVWQVGRGRKTLPSWA